MLKGICLTLTFAFPLLAGCVTSPDDGMRRAKETNEGRPLPMSEESADFLVEMADARTMDTAEGRLATEHGTTAAIRDYGRLMLEDQAVLAEALTGIAADAGVALPATLSEEKSAVLQDLSELRGEEFDQEFIETITLDHERDVKAFGEAREMAYGPVREFAVTYLPMIEKHLALIEDIERRRAAGS